MPDQAISDQITLPSVQQATHRRLAAALLRINAEASQDTDDADNATLAARLKQINTLVGSAVAAEPVEVRFEYGVWWHVDGRDTIALDQEHISSLDQALRVAPHRVGRYGISHFTVVYRTHVPFDDGSTWTSSWQPVDHRGPLHGCLDCCRPVFRASSTDNSSVFLLDADPAPDGELVLIPNVEHGGEPGAIYGAEPQPGVRRYHRHDCRRTHA